MLEVLAAWLGIELDESMDEATRRELVLHSAEATRWRGTRAGLEMALRLTFPDLPLRVEDEGGVVFTRDARARSRRRPPTASSSTATRPSRPRARPSSRA